VRVADRERLRKQQEDEEKAEKERIER